MDYDERMKALLRALPDKPGVYFHKNREGKIIYIGKASSLKHRVSSYFSKTQKDAKTSRLVADIADVEVIVTQTEVEALILEAELIKKHTPFYNISLKDSKTYPFITITNERFPRIIKTRHLTKDGRYFGPYVNARHANEILAFIERRFPLRTCKKTDFSKNARNTMCLNYHIKKCKAPCSGRISEAAYNEYIAQAELLLEGNSDALLRTLETDMREHARALEFEKAKTLRDQIDTLKTMFVEQSVYALGEGDKDAIGIHGEYRAEGGYAYTAVVLLVRSGKLIDKKSFSFISEREEAEALAEFTKRYYHGIDDIPSEVIIPSPLEDMRAIAEWLSKRSKKTVAVAVVERRSGLGRIAYENARLLAEEGAGADLAERGMERLKEAFGLPDYPRVIEGYDITHLDGKYMKAAMVRFENGAPNKKEYRIFNITTVDYIDDPKAIHEAVYRRYTRMKNEGAPLPDLILVDGGKPQLNAAIEALKEAEIYGQKIVGLAKRFEEIYFPNRETPLRLPKNDDGLRLLQRVRDEAHRFGNVKSKARRNDAFQSALETIDGVGPKARKALFDAFKTIDAIKEASFEDLCRAKGVNKAVAKNVYERYHQKANAQS